MIYALAIASKTRRRRGWSARRCALSIAMFLAIDGSSFSQTPDEHAKHHPSPAGSSTPAGDPAAASTPGMSGNQSTPPPGGGMAAGMGEMMKQMGVPPRKELYPALMALPDQITAEQRTSIEQLAQERMKSGAARLSAGLQKLTISASGEDYAAMQQSAAQMREGLAEFESGIAARRVLSEGKTPRNLALDWFKREMNLASPVGREEPYTVLGVTPFHLFTMVLLVSFALAMVAMYFFKMRRAAALFGRIGPDANPPIAGLPEPSPSSPPTSGSPSAAPAPGGAAASATVTPSAQPNANGPAAPKGASTSPVSANWKGQLRIANIVAETPGVKTFRLQASSQDRDLPFTFVPGQFLNVAFWIGGAKMNRSYSISSSPTLRNYVDLTVRREPRGAVSRHMDDLLKVGDQIDVGGPVGKFTFTGAEADSIVLISAGVGITPMMSIARYLTDLSWHGDIFFVYTCHTEADFIFADDLAALARRNPKLHILATISKPVSAEWKGDRGRITKQWLTQAVPDLAARRIHVCGPPSMMESIKAILAEVGVPPERLKTEAFGAVKPAPAVPGTTAAPTAPATGPVITFSKNNKSAKIHIDLKTGDSPPKQTILELSEELGIGIEFSCRVGTCGLCKVKMISGEVEMEVQDALDDDDRANHIILACQAKPIAEVTVEA